jgi:hypothetical protein
MASMRELKASNTIQALVVTVIMADYKNARTKCMNECIEKMASGSKMEELGPFIDAEQAKAKEKAIESLKECVTVIAANLAEAKTFEVPDTEFITNTEYALAKAALLIGAV